jgi:phage tail sheath gpL-like
MANAPIIVPGLPGNQATPGFYKYEAFAQGAASSGAGVYSVIIIGNKTSAGSATADTVIYGPDTPVTMSSVADAITLFGQGSEDHRCIKRFMAINQVTKLYAIAVSEGGSATASTGTITIATNATGFSTLRIFVQDESVDVGIATGDTPTIIATNAIAAINGRADWAVTATNVAGVITITSKNKGLRANLLRYSAQLMVSGIGTTATPVATTAMTGGTVSDDLTTALATILADGNRYYYHVVCADDTTQLNLVLAQIQSQSQSTVGICQRIVGASVDTLANATTVATSVNHERIELPWQYKSDWTPGELAANAAAVYSYGELGSAFRLNFNGFGNDPDSSNLWKVPAPRSVGVAPTPIQIEAALNSGLSPIRIQGAGKTSLVRRITSRFKSGSQVDYRIRPAHKVTIEDRFADDLGARTVFVMANKQISADPIGNDPPVPNAMTPTAYKNLVLQLVREYGDNGMLQDVQTIIAQVIVQIEVATPDRISAYIPLRPIDTWNTTAVRIDQIA